ncbi:hypothetical protein D9M72_486910 [compost metagenome]
MIDQRVARAAVIGNERFARADEGQVGNAADIDEDDRRRETGCTPRQSGVIGGDQRRALPAMHHVVGAHVVDDVNSRFAGKQRAVADLYRQGFVGTVQHGLPVEADHVDSRRRQVVLLQEGFDCFGMPQRQVALKLRQRAGPLIPLRDRLCVDQSLLQPVAKAGVIGKAGGGAALDDVFAVGPQHGDVDAVHARAAHQADCRSCPCHAVNISRITFEVIMRGNSAKRPFVQKLPRKRDRSCPVSSPISFTPSASVVSSTRSPTSLAWMNCSGRKS